MFRRTGGATKLTIRRVMQHFVLLPEVLILLTVNSLSAQIFQLDVGHFQRSDVAYDIEVTENKSLLIGGNAEDCKKLLNAFITKLKANGEVDQSFAEQGIFMRQFSPHNNGLTEVRGLAQYSDGRIIAAGYVTEARSGLPATSDSLIFRLHANGTQDESFANNGTSIQNHADGAYPDGFLAVSVQPDNSILAAGATATASIVTQNTLLVKLTDSGNLDLQFGSEGVFIAFITNSRGERLFSRVLDLTVRDDGRILLGGYSNHPGNNSKIYPTLIQLQANGTLDNRFSDTGQVILESLNMGIHKIALDQDGHIVCAGFRLHEQNRDFAILSLNDDGSSNRSFGVNGTFIYDITNADVLNDIFITDHNIVATGRSGVRGVIFWLSFDGRLERCIGPDPDCIRDWLTVAIYAALPLPGSELAVVGNIASRTTRIGDTDIDIGVARLKPDGEPDNCFAHNPSSRLTIAVHLESTNGEYTLKGVLQRENTTAPVQIRLSGGDYDNTIGPIDDTFGFKSLPAVGSYALEIYECGHLRETMLFDLPEN